MSESKAPEIQNMEPIADRVVVQRDKAESMTKGGIALPDGAEVHPLFGTVKAVGPGALRPMTGLVSSNGDKEYVRFPMQCKVGDRVLLPPGIVPIKLIARDESSEIVVCQEIQLLAILH